LEDVVWLTPQGVPKNEEDWTYPDARCLAFLLNGLGHHDFPGKADQQHLLLFLNGHHDLMPFIVPPAYPWRWARLLDTSLEDDDQLACEFAPGDAYGVAARSTVIMVSVGEAQRQS